MGVHYFYTWVTRRYPLFKKLYDPEIIPAIDNFFIDLNGVLYRCAKDDKALFRDILKGKNFGEIFASIFNYINFLVNHTRPRKRIYIAIDGVAPRAKMNNQRQRRYHSARANKSLNDFLTNELQTDPGVVSFKNNSISPGTDFMMDLIDHVKFFVQRKIHEDDNWKGIEVIFSGGDIPGEGEHKIMDWLRGWKQSPDYDINESHCVYSNDADLIFLGLSLHLPKMLILREVHKFSDNPVNSATKRTTEEPQIELLFINILREYMELEYAKDKEKYTHEFDLERVIDDFILIAYFIGNDFLHQLYCMSTKKGNFDEMIEIFKSTLPNLGGYLSDKGRINWTNFGKFLQKIMPLEVKMIETTLEQMTEYLKETKESKQSLFNSERDRRQRDFEEEEDHTVTKNSVTTMDEEEDDETGKNKTRGAVAAPADEDDEEDDEEDQHEFHEDLKAQIQHDDALKKLDKNYELEFQLNYTKINNEVHFIADILSGLRSNDPKKIQEKKLMFYKKFFKLGSLAGVDQVCMDYMKGMQFVMHYYFHGCPSWDYYYPYFMSPFLSDLIEVVNQHANDVRITFDRAGPYKPFDQLAYILPRASMGLLPDEYSRVLLSDPRTEKYYPAKMEDFEPFDGIHDYQWIAKLELFNDKDMNAVLKTIDDSKFTHKEKRRNSQATPQIFRYNAKAPAVAVKSIIQGLNDFTEHIDVLEVDLEKMYPFDESKMDYKMDGLNPDDGFPSLKIVDGVTGSLSAVSRKAKYRKFILKINPDTAKPDRTRNGLKGFVFYDYPFKKVAYVNTEVTAEGNYTTGNLESKIVGDIAYQKNVQPNRLHDVYKVVQDDSTEQLYREKGIDFCVRGDRESYYEIEYRKSTWRTVLDAQRKLIYDFDYVQEIYPHGLLFPFDMKTYQGLQTQLRFPKHEDELFRPGNTAVNLYNGDVFTIKETSKSNITVSGVVTKPNQYPSRQVVEQKKLLDQHWRLIDKSFLKELGLQESEILVLYGIMDSVVIRTDSSKTSSLILGQMFDIGLRMFKALGVVESKLQIVVDLVKGQGSYTSLWVKKFKGDSTYYDIFLSSKGVDLVKGYFKAFPEVIDYMRSNVSKWNKKYELPRVHDIKKIYINKHDEDLNVRLFKIYQWIMVNDTSSLSLMSALSLNASSDLMKTKIDEAMHKVTKESSKPSVIGTQFEVDMNMTIVNIPMQFAAGTSYEQHPPYPQLGNRVIYVNNHSPHIPFGRVGTVTGIYKSKIEIMFDEPFIGANNLSGRCDFFRGAFVDFLDLYNMTEWKRYVNTKKNQFEKVKLAFQKTKSKQQLLPHERLVEWDGKLDGMLLIRQMSKIKEDSSRPDNSEAQKKPKLKPTSDDFAGQQMQPKGSHQFTSSSAQSQPYFAPKPSGQQGGFGAPKHQNPQTQHGQAEQPKAQFEMNPQQKLKPKKKPAPAAEEVPMYVVKQTSSQQTAPPTPNPAAATKGPVTADELERQMLQASQPQSAGLRLEDLEAHLKSGK